MEQNKEAEKQMLVVTQSLDICELNPPSLLIKKPQ